MCLQPDGDTVLVKPGEYVITEPINFNRLHDPENPDSPPVKNIIVKSERGAEVTTIRMGVEERGDRPRPRPGAQERAGHIRRHRRACAGDLAAARWRGRVDDNR